MHYLPLLVFLLVLAGCGSHDRAGRTDTKIAKAPDATLTAMDPVPADWQPEAFLDSVGRLPTAPLIAHATQYADSVFRPPPQVRQVFSASDLRLLKRTQQTGFLEVRTAQRLFGDTSISAHCNWVGEEKLGNDKVQVRYVPFGARGTDEYALCVGAPAHCDGAAMYFFKGNKLIARHKTSYDYDESLHYYRDAEGHAVVYYLYSFLRGSGNWWNQYFFYRYEGERLVPVLTELENGNLAGFGGLGARTYWLEATVQKTNPLTLKMVYYVEMPDTASTKPRLLDDSTLVEYRWNRQTGRLEGQYQRAKITYPQVLSYNATTNDLLFINTYYARLRRALTNAAERPAARRYLWSVWQDYGQPQHRSR